MVCTALATAEDSSIILSTYNLTNGAQVNVGCRIFGRRLTSGAYFLTCDSNRWKTGGSLATTAETSFKCEWNGDLTMYEKLIIGMASAGGGMLLMGLMLICCLAVCYKNKRDMESDGDSYPPSQINEKVGYAQYGGGRNGDSGGIRGNRPSGKYEKQITSESRNDYPRDGPYSDSGKRDPFLWSGYNENQQSREPERPDTGTGFQFYSGNGGKQNSQYDNRAYDRNEHDRGGGYRETGYHGTNYQQGKREDYRWNGQLPRAQVGRDDRYNRQY